MARFADSNAERIVAREATRRAIAPLPARALRLPADTLSGLARVGLRLVGQIMERPRGPLARRFGKQVLLRIDQALGAVEEAISPRLPVPELTVERRLAEPVMTIEAIEQLGERLAARLCQELERRGQGARILDLALYRVDGRVVRLGVGASRPLREPRTIMRLFRERLAGLNEEIDAGYGFDMLRLSAASTQPFEGHAPQFFANHQEMACVSDLVDRLTARLGARHILQATSCDTHLPEQAESLSPASETILPTAPVHTQNGTATAVFRPLRLFREPERIEAMAQVPDGPPVRFRWRRVLHEITRAEGPERIADEWWHGGATRQTRDYFRVEDRQGRRYWLFRAGLYGSEVNSPRWYVHGLFA